MSSNIIKADNGVTSGVTGIVQTAGSDGTLQLQTTTSGGTATTALTIDNSQNVGVGVTPSAWQSYKAIQTSSGAILSYSTNDFRFTSNALRTGGNWQYINTAPAVMYLLDSSGGTHQWYNAVSGTAGNTISFTQAMTLDNSGNLLVNTTNNISSARVNVAQGSSDGVMYQMMQFTGGSGTGGNEVGLMKRQTTASVSNSATTIESSLSFGELITVTGVGSGAIFADLLMASYNTVAVISSNTQQGSPASRTYSISSGALRLTMGSSTSMAITVQSLICGARGA